MLKRFVLTFLLFALVLITIIPFALRAQAQKETVAKPQTDKQKADKEKKLRKELASPYKKWLDEVGWIISDEERTAFSRLETDEQKQSFIESFWLRRDPTPDTDENEFREEHYRRVAWANDRYASGTPGWKTDRGMIYIKLGAPDETDEHPTGGPGIRSIEEGGGQTTFFPYETWRYRYIEGVGSDITIEFVDKSMTNEYRMTWNPSEKDAMLNVPGAGLTLYEQMGLADKADRFTNGPMTLGKGPLTDTAKMNVFDRLNQYTNLQKAPPVKFKDLEAAVNSTIKYNLLPMLVRTDYIPVTEASVLTYIAVQFDRADLQFQQKDGAATATVNIQARLTTMTGKRVGTVMEDTVHVGPFPSEQLGQFISGKSLYSSKQALMPGRYKLSIVAKDMVGGNLATYDVAIDVPRYQEDELGNSSLILADVLEKVPTNSIGKEQFVIGSTKVRPKLDETFKKTDTMGIYMQLFNFQQNPETRKPEGTVEFEVIRNGSNESVIKTQPEDLTTLTGGASQMILEKKLKLDSVGLTPGDYTLKIKVTDSRRNETLTPSAHFKVI
ncbi:MAG: GWxTD domain-containing protein [Acidobacteriota bacterium]